MDFVEELLGFKESERKNMVTAPEMPIRSINTIEDIDLNELCASLANTATDESIINIKAVYYILNKLGNCGREEIVTGFIYGSTAQGASSRFNVYSESKRFKNNMLEEAVFTKEASKERDLNVAFFVHKSSKFRDYLIPALKNCSELSSFKTIPVYAQIITLEDFLLTLDDKTSLIKRLLSYSPMMVIKSLENCNILKDMSLENSNPLDFDIELELRAVKELHNLMRFCNLTEYTLNRDDYKAVFPNLLDIDEKRLASEPPACLECIGSIQKI